MQALLALSSSFCAVKLCSLLPLFFDFLPDAMEAAMEALGVLVGVLVTELEKRRLWRGVPGHGALLLHYLTL